MAVYLARSPKQDKTLLVGVRAGGLTGFAALRYDLRSLLRYACAVLTALAALRRLTKR